MNDWMNKPFCDWRSCLSCYLESLNCKCHQPFKSLLGHEREFTRSHSPHLGCQRCSWVTDTWNLSRAAFSLVSSLPFSSIFSSCRVASVFSAVGTWMPASYLKSQLLGRDCASFLMPHWKMESGCPDLVYVPTPMTMCESLNLAKISCLEAEEEQFP